MPEDDKLEKVADAIAQRIARGDSLLDVSDEELLSQDSVGVSRLTYVVSLLRLLSYLRADPPGFAQRGAQASLAMAYVRHVEATNMKAMQLGRSESDRQLALEVAQLRRKIAEVGRQRVLAKQHDITLEQVLPREKKEEKPN